MKRLLKILAWVLGLLAALIVIAVIVIPLVVDPNDYRDQINALVERQTGRELTIEGELDLSVFPWLGLEMGETRLGNAQGFGPEPFASVEGVDVRVKLLPLLRREVEVDTIRLTGLQVNLARKADGTNNWEDLAGPGGPAPAPTEPEPKKGPPVAALAIGGLEVRNARVSWDDRQADRQVTVSSLNLTSGEVAPGETFPLALDFNVDSSAPEMKGAVALNTRITLDLRAQTYRLDQTQLTTDLNTPLVPGRELDARLAIATALADLGTGRAEVKELLLEAFGAAVTGQASAEDILGQPKATGSVSAELRNGEKLAAALGGMAPDGMQVQALQGARVSTAFSADLAEEVLDISTLDVNALGARLQGSAQGRRILTEPQFTGKLTSEEFVPRDITTALGIELPEMSDPGSLSKAKLALEFDASPNAVALRHLSAQVDQSTLKGRASVANFDAPAIKYELALDQIDLDRYLPPPAETPETPAPATPGAAAGAAAAELPLDMLRSLNIDGRFTIGSLKAANLKSQEILTVLKADGGLFRVNPARARLYGGSYAGNLTFDVREETPRIAMDEKLSGVQSGPLLEDLVGKPHVTGTANLAAKLTARGIEPEAVKKTLSGDASFRFTDGAVKGVSIGEMIRNAYARAKRQPAPEGEAQETDFAELQGTLQIRNGIVRNDDLSAKSPLLRVTGKGQANLVDETVDYLVTTEIVSTLEGQGGAEADELKGVPIPIRVVGPLTDPAFKVEIAQLLEQRAREALERKKEEAEAQARQRLEEQKSKAEERAREQLEEQKKKLEEELGDKLKGLFN